MTESQALRLRSYSEKMGLTCEIVYNRPKYFTTTQRPGIVLRVKRQNDHLWAWCFGPKHWINTVRYLRGLDRFDAGTR